MKVEVTSLSGDAEVVEITASAKLSFERKHKKSVKDEVESGMVGPVYDLVHRALRIQQADTTPEDMDEWLGTVADMVIIPADPLYYFMAVCHELTADQTQHTAELVASIAEMKRAGIVAPEPVAEVPTGGETTPQLDVSPEPSSGQGKAPRRSPRSKPKTQGSATP